MRQRAEQEARQWGRAEAAALTQESEEESDSEDERPQGQQRGAAPNGDASIEQRQGQQAQQPQTLVRIRCNVSLRCFMVPAMVKASLLLLLLLLLLMLFVWHHVPCRGLALSA